MAGEQDQPPKRRKPGEAPTLSPLRVDARTRAGGPSGTGQCDRLSGTPSAAEAVDAHSIAIGKPHSGRPGVRRREYRGHFPLTERCGESAGRLPGGVRAIGGLIRPYRAVSPPTIRVREGGSLSSRKFLAHPCEDSCTWPDSGCLSLRRRVRGLPTTARALESNGKVGSCHLERRTVKENSTLWFWLFWNIDAYVRARVRRVSATVEASPAAEGPSPPLAPGC